MRRALALVGAILLVVVAVVVRGAMDDSGSDDENDIPDADSDLVIACVRELREACEALDGTVRIQDPADTIAAVEDGDAPDAWVTLDPWPTMAGFDLGRDYPGDVVGIARTDLVLLVRAGTIDDCDPLSWRCVAFANDDFASMPQRGSALLPLVLGQATADFFGSSGVVRNDIDADPDLATRINGLTVPSGDPFDDVRVGLPQPAAVGALAVDLPRLGGRQSQFDVVPTNFPASVAVVVAGPAADRVAGDRRLTAGLDDLGWTLEPDATTTGLPEPGTLFALLQEVS